MAYSDDAVKAKLAALNETQDSIVTNAQWIMFHRRHADKTASLWLQRLQESNTTKRLNLIYLANEVVQQSRARGKQDFLLAFEPVIADATALAYKSGSQEVQGKLKRVVQVWRQRQIFDIRIQEGVEARIAELDKARGNGKANGIGPRLGGSLFGGGVSGAMTPELEGLYKAQTALSRAEAGVRPAVSTADTEFMKLTDANTPLPTPPVHAARLSALLRTLATAQGAVEASMHARKELLAGLEKLLESNRAKLAEDEATTASLLTRRNVVEDRKKEVEDGIMRGLSAPTSPSALSPPPGSLADATPQPNGNAEDSPADYQRPEPESLTPPPPEFETFTPPEGADAEGMAANAEVGTFVGDGDKISQTEQLPWELTRVDAAVEQAPPREQHAPPPDFFAIPPIHHSGDTSAAKAEDFLANLGAGMLRQASSELLPTLAAENGDPRLKRRKISHRREGDVDEDIFGNGTMGGVDEDAVGAMLDR